MRKLNGLILISVMACSMASAQMVIKVDDVPIDNGVIDSISIDPVLNELNIYTTLNYDIEVSSVGDSVAINSFSPSSGTVVAGQTVTFSWNTSNAVSCQPSNGVDGWADTTISPLDIGDAIITTATTGTHTYTLTCNGSEVNDTVAVSASVTTTAANALAITSFSADPDSITTGETTTLSWNTLNAVSCTPTGGTADWTSQQISLPSGSADIAIDSVGTYAFSLTCVGENNDQQTKSDAVIVSSETQSCSNGPLGGNVIGWNTFWGTSFPGPVYENIRNWVIPQKGYLAIEFNSGNVIDTGTIASLENSATPGIRIGSISQCQGDFDTSADCSYSWGLGGGIRWTSQGVSGACDIDANATYYFNITYTDGVDPNSTNCNNPPCYVNLQHANF